MKKLGIIILIAVGLAAIMVFASDSIKDMSNDEEVISYLSKYKYRCDEDPIIMMAYFFPNNDLLLSSFTKNGDLLSSKAYKYYLGSVISDGNERELNVFPSDGGKWQVNKDGKITLKLHGEFFIFFKEKKEEAKNEESKKVDADPPQEETRPLQQEQAPVQQNNSVSTPAHQQNNIVEENQPHGTWVVVLGSFKTEEEAAGLLTKCKEANVDVELLSTNSFEKLTPNYLFVCAGKGLAKKEAQNITKNLKAKGFEGYAKDGGNGI